MFDNGTSVGIGTITPAATHKLAVTNSSTASSNNAIHAILGTSAASTVTSAAAIYGESSTGLGLVGVSTSQNGIYGQSTTGFSGSTGVSTGTAYGIAGTATATGAAGYFDGGTLAPGILVPNGGVGIGTATPNGRLVVSQSTTSGIDTAAAIYGYVNGTVSCYKGGVYGTYNTANYGVGVQGIGWNGTNYADVAVGFPNLTALTTTGDFGMYGSAATAGVVGTSNGGSGVRGFSNTSQGLLGYSGSPTTGGAVGVGNTIGVFANSVTLGSLTVPATRYGVYGQASGATTNWAGYFNGNVNIVGTLAKGGGTFKIDHPLDPENKYLYHSFVESPDMMNIYNGNVTTDANGFATVTMPGYFDALNKDFRYQLTAIGTFAQAIVKEEMQGNSFVIQTSQPNVKVSWQVTGVREDKFAEAHRVEPEVAKEKENVGKYIHPAEWGVPAARGIDYDISRANSPEGIRAATPSKK